MLCGECEPSDEEGGIDDLVEEFGQRLHDCVRECTTVDEHSAVCRPRYLSPIAIRADAAVVEGADLGACQALDVIADGQLEAVTREAFLLQLNGEGIRHLPDDEACILRGIRMLDHLSHMCAA